LCWIGAASGGRQEPRQKRRLLNFVLSNCTWEDGEVVVRQPFDLLAETSAIAARDGAGNTAKSSKSEIWLHTEDSNAIPNIRDEESCHSKKDSAFEDGSAHWPMWAIRLEGAMGASQTVLPWRRATNHAERFTLFVVCRISASNGRLAGSSTGAVTNVANFGAFVDIGVH
jgi:hypothetical protein